MSGRHLLKSAAAGLLASTMLVAIGHAQAPAGSRAAPVVGIADGDLLSSNRLIGRTVLNGSNETVGKIDSLLLSEDFAVRAVVVEVGGFLGVGAQLVALPIENFVFASDSVTLPTATKDQLQKAPAYEERQATLEPSPGTGTASETRKEAERTRVEIDRTAEEWKRKLDDYSESAKGKTEAGFENAKSRLDSAWATVEREWSNVKAATKEGWNDAQSSFDEAVAELDRVWQEVAG